MIASWNVNSIKVRVDAVLDWLASSDCDILLMQETKSMDENFPTERFAEAGYAVEIHGQKTYNGVAIASKQPMVLRQKGLGDSADEQARYLEIEFSDFIIASIYLPNGNPVMDEGNISAKFTYKLAWMERLIRHADALNQLGRPVILAGDFNIIPDALDCHDLARWHGDALHHPHSLKLWRGLTYLGYADSFRALNPSRMAFSFWDYQGGAWQKDDGIRIDHILINAEAADRITASDIDKTPRGLERASDHTPVFARFGAKSQISA